MFVLNDDMSIYATRGDTVFFTVGATDGSGAKYKFKPDDVVRFKAFEKKACENVVAQKDFVITEETEEVNILLTEDDTRFGKIISKPRDYWYEIELNPFTNPQTIIGYDDDGPKVFRLYPESKNIVKDISEEDFYADAELSMTSTNPVQNQAVTRAVANLSKYIDDGLEGVKDSVLSEEEALRIRGELRVLDSDVASLKSDFTEHKSDKNPHGTTASDVGAVAFSIKAVTGSLAEFCKSLKVYDSGIIGYYSVSDSPSDMAVGYLIYTKHNTIGSSVHCVAYYMGTARTGYYDAASDKMIWGKGFNDYLPLSGGTLSGTQIDFKDGMAAVIGNESFAELRSRKAKNDEKICRTLRVANSSDVPVDAVNLVDYTSTSAKAYRIFGQHNKPTGSYTGNGNATQRKINIGGIGSLLIIIGCGALTFAANGGAWVFRGGAMPELISGIDFSNGILTLSTTNMYVNDNGTGFFFYVL